MSKYAGDIAEDASITFWWSTNDVDGESITRATDGTIKVRRDDGTDCTGSSVTDTEDTPDTGVHECTVDTSDNANYATGHDYLVWLDGAVIDGRTVNADLHEFSIENRFAEVDVTKISGSSTAADVLAAKNFSAHSDGVVVVVDSTTDTGRAANLRTAYTAAKALTPGGNALATNNRAKVLIPDGRYDFGTGDGSNHGLEVDGEFVDPFGLSGDPDRVVLTSQIATESRGTLEQTADDVRIRGVTIDIAAASLVGSGSTRPAAYFPGDNLPNTKIEYCKFTTQNTVNAYAMRTSIEYSGEYTRCKCFGNRGFGSNGTLSGTCESCEHYGNYGFGGSGILDVNGICIDCVHYGDRGYGGEGTLRGMLLRCVNVGNAGWRNCEGAMIEDTYLKTTLTDVDCLILKDDLTTVTDSTILVKEGGTGIPINDDGSARTVVAAGNRYNNLAQSATGLGPNVTNRGIGDVADTLGYVRRLVSGKRRYYPVGTADIVSSDLCYMGDDNKVYPASSQADQGSESANQELFANNFVGVAEDNCLAGNNVWCYQDKTLHTFSCPDDTYAVGQLVGVDENAGGNGLLDSTVTKVNHHRYAIGRVAAAVTGTSVEVVPFGREESVDWEDGRRLDLLLDGIPTTGSGSVSWTINVKVGGNPIDGAEVRITSDEEGNTAVAGPKYTDASGDVDFLLDTGTYFAWVQSSGKDFSNPTTITVTT